MSTVGCLDLHQVACGTEKLYHHTCNSAKRTLAGACVKCYSLLVDTRVLSSIVGCTGRSRNAGLSQDSQCAADMKKHNVAYIPTMSLDDFAFAYAGFACLGKRTVLPSGTRSGRVRDDHQPPITKQKRAR